MKPIRLSLLLTLFTCFALPAPALPKYTTWTARLQPGDVRAGEGAQVLLTVKVEKPWHLYSLTQAPGGPIKTTLELQPGALEPAGNPVQSAFKKMYDKGFKMNIEVFEGAATFGIPVKVKKGVTSAQSSKIKIKFQLCNDTSCLPPDKEEVNVAFKVAAGAARPNRKPVLTLPKPAPPTKKASLETPSYEGTLILIGDPETASAPTQTDATTQQIAEAKRKGLLAFLSLSMGFGFLALLTPCVFPMIPITVSFFTKRKEGSGGVKGAIVYCLGIMSTFTVLGLLVSILFGADRISKFGTNPYINLAFAILFIVLGLNLLGVYEIAAPSSLANKAQAHSRKGGLLQPFFMGLAFTLTSFTCTAPYVGTLLASAAHGNTFYPLIGMLAFSTAFALPFFLLALFPQGLARIPKSGSWLVTVKAFMGMLELAAALKFLSNADLVWQKGWLTREVFLAIWATIGVIAGLYLLGWLRLPHDDSAKVGWTRRLIGLGTVAAGCYCFAAIQGASLGWFSAFPPPTPYPGRTLELASVPGGLPKPDADSGKIVWLSDYDQAVARAKAEEKPILINFTGVTCTNCRLMEQTVFPRPDVTREFHNYVTVELYTDRDNPGDEKNKALEEKLVNTVALPVYVAVTPEGKVLKTFQGLAQRPADFVTFLQEGRGAKVAAIQ